MEKIAKKTGGGEGLRRTGMARTEGANLWPCGTVDFCCGRNYEFTPIPLQCLRNETCSVKPYGTYFSTEDEMYVFCEACFKKAKYDKIAVSYSPRKLVNKRAFIKHRNGMTVKEPTVRCSLCLKKYHKACVLHVSDSPFVCQCCAEVRNLGKINPYGASTLPKTQLSEHIEGKVNAYLRSQIIGDPIGEVTIRVVVSVEKEMKIKNNLLEKIDSTNNSYPYQYKKIVAFQKIQGVDVIFFAFIVQEYGAKCPLPNKGRAYLAYLDSVQFFRPRHLRTHVYHIILLGYFEFIKSQGFSDLHIWACPPNSTGSDYIFYAHPLEQKVPDANRLRNWYEELIEKGIEEGIIQGSRYLISDMKETEVRNISQIPYFDGDYWPNFIEEQLGILSSPPTKKRKTKSNSSTSQTSIIEDYSSDNIDPIMASIIVEMYAHKDIFYVLQLNDYSFLKDKDVDGNIYCSVMDGRDAFLQLSLDNKFEFSSLRRSKYSTMGIIKEIQLCTKVQINCDFCNITLLDRDTRYSCKVCDFDICLKCFNTNVYSHEHELSFKLGIEKEPRHPPPTPIPKDKKARFEKATLILKAVLHTGTCFDPSNCKEGYTREKCTKAHQLFFHIRICKKRDTCIVCYKLYDCEVQHARFCRENGCLLPYCHEIQTRLQRDYLIERLGKRKAIKM